MHTSTESRSSTASYAMNRRAPLFVAALVSLYLTATLSSSAAAAASSNNGVFYTAFSHQGGTTSRGGVGVKHLRHARALLQSAEEVAVAANATIDTVKSVADDVGSSITDIVNTVRENIPSEEEAREALEEMFAEAEAPAAAAKVDEEEEVEDVDPATTTNETTVAPVEPAAVVVVEEEPTVGPAAAEDDDEAAAVPAAVEDESASAAADEPPMRRMRHLMQLDETEYLVETEETEDDDESVENAPSAAPAMAPAP